MKYRKKPVVIEASQWFIDKPHIMVVSGYINKDGRIMVDPCGSFNTTGWEMVAVIKTLEGWHKVSSGDYIIEGVKGEFYPCKPGIFDLTYELVDD